MIDQANLVILGVSIGLSVGIVIACLLFFGIRWFRKRPKFQQSVNECGAAALPIHTSGFGTSVVYSASLTDSIAGLEPNYPPKTQSPWRGHPNNDRYASTSGIPRYSYKDVQKATQNFTTILGQGSFGRVYKAAMPNGEIIAVKVLASNSKQGEKEFQTEVLLLGRLHHRNLVNLLGYCVDKGHHMLLYEFMSNGSLENILYNEENEVLSWDDRLQIALDISHGIEYLHEGAVPPVIHRDLKSANILLDHSMRAKVADFGLSKEEVFDRQKSSLKGTYGYMDPAYISSNKFTMKSDVYSFGVVIFELITAIHPQQNLMEYVNLAAMNLDGVDEILDKQLVGQCNPEEVRGLARIAYRCLHKSPRKRPSIGEVSPAILKIRQRQMSKSDTMSFVGGDISRVVSRIELQQLELSRMTSINVA